MKSPKVSIVITTKNESGHIELCLQSIKDQTYRNIEIIVVDNGSRDQTKEIAKRYTKRVFDAGPERSAQRNFGAKKARGRFLLFLDADMILTPDVVARCAKITQKNDYIAVVVPEKSFGSGFWAKCKALERSYYEHVDWIESARFFQKKAFDSIGGYDEALTGPEDFELPQRIKARFGNHAVGRITAYILHDEGKLSLAKLLRKKYYYGMRMRRYSQTQGSREYFQKQSNIFLRYELYFKRPGMFIRDPLHAFGMLIMKLLEMVAMALGTIQRREHYA